MRARVWRRATGAGKVGGAYVRSRRDGGPVTYRCRGRQKIREANMARKRSLPRLWSVVRARSDPTLERVRLVVIEDRVERGHARGGGRRQGRERGSGDGGRERRARAHLRVRARPLFEVVLEPVRVQVRLHAGEGKNVSAVCQCGGGRGARTFVQPGCCMARAGEMGRAE